MVYKRPCGCPRISGPLPTASLNISWLLGEVRCSGILWDAVARTQDNDCKAFSLLPGVPNPKPPAAEGDTLALLPAIAGGARPEDRQVGLSTCRLGWSLWIVGRWRPLSQTHLGVRPRTSSRLSGVTGAGSLLLRPRCQSPGEIRLCLWRNRSGEFGGGNRIALLRAPGLLLDAYDACWVGPLAAPTYRLPRPAAPRGVACEDSYLVDSASSHMLVSKIKPCMSKYKQLYGETANGSLNQLSFI